MKLRRFFFDLLNENQTMKNDILKLEDQIEVLQKERKETIKVRTIAEILTPICDGQRGP
jgi:Tfp pilus assembly pilus retraction ATPase PilT